MHVTGHLKCFDERRRCKKKEARILILTSLFAFAWGHQRRIRVRFASHQSFMCSPHQITTRQV